MPERGMTVCSAMLRRFQLTPLALPSIRPLSRKLEVLCPGVVPVGVVCG